MKKKESMEDNDWYRLDNIATMHSLCFTRRSTFIFRISCFLTKPVKVSFLQTAFERIIERFPYYNVYLKSGFFWFFWQKNNSGVKIIADSRYPCEWMPLDREKVIPVRVRAYGKTISCEFHHSITDGGGGIVFLKALLVEYFLQYGIHISDSHEILRSNSQINTEEYEDSFQSRYKKNIPPPEKKINALRLRHSMLPVGVFHNTSAVLSSSRLLELAKKNQVSMTEYLVSVYLYVLQKHFSKEKRYGPIRILVPVNLRKIVPSKTMRNFFLWTTPSIDTRLGYYSFKDILKNVHHQMKITVEKKEMMRQLKVNVGSQLNYALRLLPLPFKKLLIKLIYSSLGEKEHSGIITNLGEVTLPSEITDRVKGFEFIPPPVPFTKTSCAVVSYQGLLRITFGSLIDNKYVEREFFRFLVKQGLHIKIECNYTE